MVERTKTLDQDSNGQHDPHRGGIITQYNSQVHERKVGILLALTVPHVDSQLGRNAHLQSTREIAFLGVPHVKDRCEIQSLTNKTYKLSNMTIKMIYSRKGS